MTKVRRFWGWGYEGGGLDPAGEAALEARVTAISGGARAVDPPTVAELDLRSPRLHSPAAIASWFSVNPVDRAGHTYGKSFRDVVRALNRDFTSAPDVVARPPDESGVATVLEWAGDVGAIVIPYGGGSSVVGGVEAPAGDDRPVVSLDLGRLDRVLEVDRTSRAARVQAGVLGPDLEDQLRPHGLTLRHYPQSFELSTLGGWLATRSGGHFASLFTHVDDFVESLSVVSPAGTVVTRRLPGSGAGPAPERLYLGSEGILGVITEAWVRLQDRPGFRASAVARFSSFDAAATAAREVVQAGLWPANCRVLDALEALMTGAGDGSSHLLLLSFESADHPVDHWLARASELARDAGGEVGIRESSADPGEDAAGRWRSSFLRAPYLRDHLVRLGLISETFETAITWDRFSEFVEVVRHRALAALESVGAAPAVVTCRLTHVYPDGAAPYFTVLAPGRAAGRLAQWAEVKSAVMEEISAHGGTVTHHHAVGRDHRPGYDRERPELFAAQLRAAKRVVDPQGLLNPGVLIDADGPV